MDPLALAVVALAVLGFGLISGRMDRSVVTPPMVFVLFGLLMSDRVLGLVPLHVESHVIHVLAEVTLVLVLFTDASRIDLGRLRRQHTLPVRLLVIGMPLSILLGTLLAGFLFVNETFWGWIVLAAILAPTDAALGQAVVSNRLVPVRIRQALNVESGLNDGIVFPILLILLSVAGAVEETGTVRYWVWFTTLQIVLGPVAGIVVGYVGGKLVELSSRRGWMNDAFEQLSSLSLALLAYCTASLIGGNGFIAAFCAGLALGNWSPSVCTRVYEFAEAEGQLLNLIIFMVLGAVLVPAALDHFSWNFVLYGVLSLTVIRMVPVAISLTGMHLKLETILFLGWFGPRGLASILFTLLVLEESTLPGRQMIQHVVMATVCLSVFAHGLTAVPWANGYARRMEEPKPGMGEQVAVDEMPVRIPYRGS